MWRAQNRNKAHTTFHFYAGEFCCAHSLHVLHTLKSCFHSFVPTPDSTRKPQSSASLPVLLWTAHTSSSPCFVPWHGVLLFRITGPPQMLENCTCKVTCLKNVFLSTNIHEKTLDSLLRTYSLFLLNTWNKS